jgi:hypothetical protein
MHTHHCGFRDEKVAEVTSIFSHYFLCGWKKVVPGYQATARMYIHFVSAMERHLVLMFNNDLSLFMKILMRVILEMTNQFGRISLPSQTSRVFEKKKRFSFLAVY